MVHEFELLRAVVPRHDITLITTFWMIRPEALRTVQDLGVRVEVVPWPWPRAYGRHNRARKLLGLLRGDAPTYDIARRHERLAPLAEAVQREEQMRPADVVFVVQGELAPVLDAARAPSALLLYDVYSRQTSLVSNRLSLRAIRYRLERRNAARWESSWYGRANAIACVSKVDADIVRGMLDRHVETIVNPIPDEFFARPAVERSATNVTIVGSFGWEPNIDSVDWMCAEIWPLVLRARPDAQLRVVGRFASPELRAVVEGAGGRFFGDVPDIRTYYWDAAVIAANIRMGSGMRNKVLHAMACGAPLVATSSALEGIDAEAGQHLLVADDAGGLADAIVDTLNDPVSAAVRVEAARAIARRYSSAGAGAALEAWWGTVARPRAGEQPARAPSHSDPTATVIVCTRNRPELLRRALTSIASAVAIAPGTQVVVVEQGEASARAICNDIGLGALVVSDDGAGVSRARNIGTARATGDVVLFTDDDCEVPATWIRAHVEALRDPGCVASFGPVGGIRYDEDYDPVALPARHGRGSPPWIVGHSSNVAVRRSTLRSIGGFDERMGPGTGKIPAGEDADLIVRLLRTGIVVSGTGAPVRHIDWRSSDDRRANLMAYEHGAGAWIGKALREEPRWALSSLRARLSLQKGTVAHAKDVGDRSVTRAGFARAFARGLLVGMRLKPWTGNADEQRGVVESPKDDAVPDER